MTGHAGDRIVPTRPAPIRDAIVRLADGTRSAREVAEAVGVTPQNVRARLCQMGISHLLRPVRGTTVSARLPADVVLRDLCLSPEVAAWLVGQMADGLLIQDVLRGIVTDAFLEDMGL